MSNQKAKKDEYISIEQRIEFVRNKLLDIDPNSTPELIDDLQKRLSDISYTNKKKNIVLKWLVYIIAALLISSGVLLLNQFQNDEYKSELEQRLNDQIKNYNKQDSLFNKYLGVDSTGSYTTSSINGKVQSYKDLLKEKEILQKKNSELSNKLSDANDRFENLKYDYDFIVSTYQISVTKTKKGSTTYTNINSKRLEDCMGANQAAAKKAITKFNEISDSLSKIKPLKLKEKR